MIARLIRNRDVTDPKEIREYLYGTLEELPSPWLMKDMKKGSFTHRKSNQEGEKIRIIGDYDIDGVISTSILLKCLRRLGAKRQIPIFRTEWQTVTESAAIWWKKLEDRIQTILTCDNGIAASGGDPLGTSE